MEPAQRLLDDIEALAPSIRARAAEAEAARQVPIDLVRALKSVGVFRMFAPRSRDGLELSLPSAVKVVRQLARIEGSVGWTAMIGSTAALFTPMLPASVYDQIYQNGPDVIFAGSARPDGIAQPAPGGWRVTGRWPFASGCRHADWMVVVCVMNQTDCPMPEFSGSADALLWAQAESHWRHALAGTLGNEARLTEGRQAAAWLAGTCAHIAGTCFLLGGSTAIYETSPLQRRLRDLQAAAQRDAIPIACTTSAQARTCCGRGRSKRSRVNGANLRPTA